MPDRLVTKIRSRLAGPVGLFFALALALAGLFLLSVTFVPKVKDLLIAWDADPQWTLDLLIVVPPVLAYGGIGLFLAVWAHVTEKRLVEILIERLRGE